MTLRLASSGDGRAREICDHLLPLLRDRGVLELQRDSVRVVAYRVDGWILRHWTPFNELSAGEASSPAYRHAIERQREQTDLPYGLDVWRGRPMLCALWADDATFKVVSFVRGPWEAEALAL